MSGHGSVVCLGGSFADQHLRRHVGPRLLAGSGARNAQRPAGAQAGRELSPKGAAALDEEGLVDRLVADPHGLIIGEINPEPLGDLLGLHASTQRRSARCGLFFPFHCGPGGPTTWPSGAFTAPDIGPGRTRAGGRCWPVWPPSDGGPVARHAIPRSTPCTQAERFASTHCGAALSRSSKGSDPTVGRSLARRVSAHAITRCPLAQRRTDRGPTQLEEGLDSRRQRGGTTGTRRGMRRPPPRLRLLSSDASDRRPEPDPVLSPHHRSAAPATESDLDTAGPHAGAPRHGSHRAPP